MQLVRSQTVPGGRGTLSPRRAALVVALLGAVFSFGVAAPRADAATVRANVTVKGAGTVSAGTFNCNTTGNLDDRVIHDCGQHVVSNDPSIFGVSTTLTATPRS